MRVGFPDGVALGKFEEGTVGRGLLQVGDFGGGFAGARVVGDGAHLDAEVGGGPRLSDRGHVAIVAFIAGGYGSRIAVAFDVDTGDGLGRQRFLFVGEVAPRGGWCGGRGGRGGRAGLRAFE